MSWLDKLSDRQASALQRAIYTFGFGWTVFLCWLAFVNRKAAIFILLLAGVTNGARK